MRNFNLNSKIISKLVLSKIEKRKTNGLETQNYIEKMIDNFKNLQNTFKESKDFLNFETHNNEKKEIDFNMINIENLEMDLFGKWKEFIIFLKKKKNKVDFYRKLVVKSISELKNIEEEVNFLFYLV